MCKSLINEQLTECVLHGESNRLRELGNHTTLCCQCSHCVFCWPKRPERVQRFSGWLTDKLQSKSNPHMRTISRQFCKTIYPSVFLYSMTFARKDTASNFQISCMCATENLCSIYLFRLPCTTRTQGM